jgi:hypothetical protein
MLNLDKKRTPFLAPRILSGESVAPDFDVDAGTKEVLDLALEMTRTALGLADNFANGIIAKRIIELASTGERHPGLLCEGALKSLRGHLFGD